jgi:hypothetical protein
MTNDVNASDPRSDALSRGAVRVECRSCGRALSRGLTQEVVEPIDENGQPFVPSGSWHISDGSVYTGTDGKFVININDALNLRDHPDSSRFNGCCGLDGCDGPNFLCECGVEVATERSDCWIPHALIFEIDAIRIVDAS